MAQVAYRALMDSEGGSAAFNDLIHPRQRLMICAALDQAKEIRFDLLAKPST